MEALLHALASKSLTWNILVYTVEPLPQERKFREAVARKNKLIFSSALRSLMVDPLPCLLAVKVSELQRQYQVIMKIALKQYFKN